MILQKCKKEEFDKTGLFWSNDLLTSQAKNTMVHLTGQNLQLTSKNGSDSKTPGRHLSAAQGGDEEEAVTVCRLTPGSAKTPTQGDSSLRVRSRCTLIGSSLEWEGRNLPPRRPLKLAPLELPRVVQKTQKQKVKDIGLETKVAVHKLDATRAGQPFPRQVKACGVKGREWTGLGEDPAGCDPTKAPRARVLSLTEASPKVKPQQKDLGAQLARATPIQSRTGDTLSENAGGSIVKATRPLPPNSQPAPPSLSSNANAQAQQAEAPHGNENGCQATGTFQHETSRRRLRLRKAERVEEDQMKSTVSTGVLPSEGSKPDQWSHGVTQRKALNEEKGLRAERALKKASRMLEKASRKNARPTSTENLLAEW